MDRLETLCASKNFIYEEAFTFQYGQIRNDQRTRPNRSCLWIYIPVWIDQKCLSNAQAGLLQSHLHSSMDRLEIGSVFIGKPREVHIYIPVWIDQKYVIVRGFKVKKVNLHSSMDRLEMMILCYARPDTM